MTSDRETRAPSWVELQSIIPLESDDETSGKSVTSLSGDTLKRRYPDAIVEVSPRRVGIKLKDALAIADGSYEPPPSPLPELRPPPATAVAIRGSANTGCR